jgi:hypothetical protein
LTRRHFEPPDLKGAEMTQDEAMAKVLEENRNTSSSGRR